VFKVETRNKHGTNKQTSNKKAFFTEIALVAKGLNFVLFTCGSKSLSARSFITQPADRARIVPIVKTKKRWKPGQPAEHIHRAQRVGQSRRKIPIGRFSLVKETAALIGINLFTCNRFNMRRSRLLVLMVAIINVVYVAQIVRESQAIKVYEEGK